MDTKILIDGKEVGFRATARTPRIYRHKFKRDVIHDLQALQKSFIKAINAAGLKEPAEDASEEEKAAYEKAANEAQLSVVDLEAFENIAYIMAKQYDPEIPDNPDDWLDEFSTFSIYEILPTILKLWADNQKTTSKPKNT